MPSQDKSNLLPVIMYHGIHDTPLSEGLYDSVYSLPSFRFKEHLDWLIDQGYCVKRVTDIKKINDVNIDKDIILTFDDGDLSNYTVAFPLLEEKKLCAEFFITTDRIGKKDSITKDQIREMANRGMSIQSHGVTHRYLSDLSAKDLLFELKGSKETLEEITNIPVDVLALPGGRGSKIVTDLALQLGYKTVCTSGMGFNEYPPDWQSIERLSIYRNTNLKHFESLVKGRGAYYYKMLAKEKLLQIPKKVLGNRLYDRFRHLIIND